MAAIQEDRVYLQLKRGMEEYDQDFAGALRRSEEIARDEMRRAQESTKNWAILEGFGTIL